MLPFTLRNDSKNRFAEKEILEALDRLHKMG